jgi:hypothetical protein
MVYHCARCSNTGLTMHQLPSSLTSFFQPIYIPHPNHIYHIISCHSNHQSNFMLFNPKQFQAYQYKLIITLLNPIFHNSSTYIFINNFHNHKYNQISTISTYHHKFSNQYLTTQSHIFYQ